MFTYDYDYALDDILETFEKKQTSDALKELADDFFTLLNDAYEEETESLTSGKIRKTTKPFWQAVFAVKNQERIKALNQAIAYENSHLKEREMSFHESMIEDARLVFQTYQQHYVKDLTDEDHTLYHAKKNLMLLLNNIAKINALESFKTDVDRVLAREGHLLEKDTSDKHNLYAQAFEELCFSHPPLIRLLQNRNVNICFNNASNHLDKNFYLPKANTIILSCADTATVHRCFVSFADSIFHFSQTPAFQAIARNYFNQTDRQMPLPFADQVPHLLSATDYKIARFIRQNILFVQNEFEVFAKALPEYFAYLSHNKEYTHSLMMKNVLTLIDTYVQADMDNDQRKIAQLNYALKNIKNAKPIILKRTLRNFTEPVLLIKKHTIGFNKARYKENEG